MRVLLIFTLAVPVFWYPGCVTAPRLPLVERERLEDNIAPHERRHSLLQVRNWDAPVVFVGLVEKAGYVGFPVEGFFGYQMVEVTITVENILRGDIGAGRARCYYYDLRGAYNGQVSRVKAGRRYFFFLRIQQGVLRSNHDPWITAAEIGGGRHRTMILQEPVPLARQLEVLALTPGEDVDSIHFAQNIIGDNFDWGIGDWERVLLLKTLLENQFPEVRLAACTSLMGYWGQDECWDDLDIAGTAWMPPPYRATTNRSSERANRKFSADADHWWEHNAEARRAAGLAQDLLDQLRMLATHKDQRIARAYCALLNRHYPEDSVVGCPAAMRN